MLEMIAIRFTFLLVKVVFWKRLASDVVPDHLVRCSMWTSAFPDMFQLFYMITRPLLAGCNVICVRLVLQHVAT